MMNFIQFTNRFYFIFVLLLIVSCGENSALKKETIYFNETNKDWLISDTIGFNFIMVDTNEISQSFSLTDSTHYFGKSWSSFLGINTDMTFTEYQYYSFSSNYGQIFTLSLTAGFEPYDDDIYISVGKTSFDYEFKYKTIARMDWNSNYKSKVMTENGFEDEEDIINSYAEILDEYTVNNTSYSKVLHFTLNDFNSQWTDFTVTEIFVAQKYGLIKYVLNNGIEYYRN